MKLLGKKVLCYHRQTIPEGPSRSERNGSWGTRRYDPSRSGVVEPPPPSPTKWSRSWIRHGGGPPPFPPSEMGQTPKKTSMLK